MWVVKSQYLNTVKRPERKKKGGAQARLKKKGTKK